MKAYSPPCRAALLALSGAIALPIAGAVEFPVLGADEPVRGELSADGPALSNRGPFVAYRFVAAEDDRWTITLRSEDFDAYVTVGRMVGGIFDPLRYDDDSGGGNDARLRLRVDTGGEYVVLAQSAQGFQGGAKKGEFLLSLEETPAPTTDQILSLAIDSIIEGEIAETDAVDEDDETYYDLYSIEAEKGRRLEFLLRSEDFDAYLSYGHQRGDQFVEVKGNDDGGGGINGTDSRVRVMVEEDGVFHLRARALGGNGMGRYTLEVRERVVEQSEPILIASGEEQLGVLTDDSAYFDDDEVCDYYIYQGKAGERLEITLRSEEFDSFLSIGVLVGSSFEELESNDDFEDEGLDSQIKFRLPKDGEYLIRASSLDGESEGGYSLTLKSSLET
jgi:hypothetical protein